MERDRRFWKPDVIPIVTGFAIKNPTVCYLSFCVNWEKGWQSVVVSQCTCLEMTNIIYTLVSVIFILLHVLGYQICTCLDVEYTGLWGYWPLCIRHCHRQHRQAHCRSKTGNRFWLNLLCVHPNGWKFDTRMHNLEIPISLLLPICVLRNFLTNIVENEADFFYNFFYKFFSRQIFDQKLDF